jgi:undecaprenyl phosphate-alpha-L-ara4N flippase subunit ArnF
MSNARDGGWAWASLTVAVLASAVAQLLLKTGVTLLSGNPSGLWWVAGGLACYAVSLLAWLKALTRLPLSVAYPMLGISYILVYVGAMASPLLAEAFTPARAAGVLLVTCGAALVSASTDSREPA